MIENDKVFLDYVNKYTLKNKSPLFWFGAKTNLIDNILKIIPIHNIYVEPFAGGATIFFHKRIVSLNVLNDIDNNLTNFYIQAKINGDKLLKYISAIPYNIHLLNKFYQDLKKEKIKDDLIRAVIFFAVINSRYNCGGYTSVIRCSKYNKKFIDSNGIDNRRDFVNNYNQKIEILKEAINKLQNCEIYNEDAFDIIKRYDSDKTLFYIDPPYPNSKQRYKDKFNINKMKELIDLLKNIKGKFILNCYEEDIKGMDINCFNIEKAITLKGNRAKGKISKTELIIYNYKKEEELFV